MNRTVLKLVRGGLILLFGAVPASSLLPLVLWGAIGGLAGFLGGDLMAAGYLLWALCGAYGSVSLWILVFREPGAVTIMGLLAGTIAMLFWVGIVAWEGERVTTSRELAELVYFNVAPMIVATITMGRFFYKRSQAPLLID